MPYAQTRHQRLDRCCNSLLVIQRFSKQHRSHRLHCSCSSCDVQQKRPVRRQHQALTVYLALSRLFFDGLGREQMASTLLGGCFNVCAVITSLFVQPRA